MPVKSRRVDEPVAQKFVVERSPELKSVVVVALVVVEFVAVNDWSVVEPFTRKVEMFERVEDAVEINPFKNARVVEVAFSPVPRVVNGKAKELPQPVQLVTVKLPIDATLALRSVVEARFDTKRFVEVALFERSVPIVPEAAVKLWRVVEPVIRS